MAQRVGRGIAPLFHDHGTRRGVSGQQHAPAVLYPRERSGTHCTGGCEGPKAGLVGRKNLAPKGFDSRTVQPGSSVAIPNELPGPCLHSITNRNNRTFFVRKRFLSRKKKRQLKFPSLSLLMNSQSEICSEL